ncbi:hypothetical protein AJ79_01020 [Helicocarpus griseus UAMH5409]|uniref:Aflatoxin regulatory protein domain-containing protein n=1 Tax=Helicocarpus griseus UAMH5409 TaxID=1447875 RepID=A0A2B7Y9R2_9EURO|nr:hypothetical protein AJ79_01020 [Helicocarpus griseus UAMH5409]
MSALTNPPVQNLDFDIETDTPVSSFPSPDAVAQSLLLPSSYDCFSGVASSDQSTRNLQSKSANARSNTTNNDANQPQHRSPHIPDTTGYLPSWSPRSPKNSPVLLMTPVSSGTQRQTPSMQSTERNHAKDGCKCLHLTACLLEKLGAEKVRDETTALDALLGCFRRGLVQYNTILGCDRCVSLSENNMLLVMAGQYMGAICQRIVMTYLGLQRGHNQHEQTVIPAGGWNTDGSGFEWNSEGDRGNSTDITVSAKGKGPRTAGDMWFCSYRIESGSERMQVLRCLITVQVTEFTQILEKLRARAGNRREHLMLLTGTEKRIKRIRRLLYDNFNWSLDGGI